MMLKNNLKSMLGVIVVVSVSSIACTQKDAQSTQNPPSQEENRPPHGKPPQFSELLKEMDKNKDGKLSLKEIKGPLKNDFSKVDTNKDGFITEAEFKNAPPPPPNKKN